jgi:hypothetical protein
MRRIIGTIAATLAIAATVVTPAAAQGRDGDRGRDRDRDAARIFYATTNQDLLLNFTERRPDRVVDAQPVIELEPADGNPRRAGPETLDGIDFDPPVDKIRMTSVAGTWAGSGELNPGGGSLTFGNLTAHDGEAGADANGGEEGPVTGGGEDGINSNVTSFDGLISAAMAALLGEEEWFDDFEEDELDEDGGAADIELHDGAVDPVETLTSTIGGRGRLIVTGLAATQDA